jgi:hypothetical protein
MAKLRKVRRPQVSRFRDSQGNRLDVFLEPAETGPWIAVYAIYHMKKKAKDAFVMMTDHDSPTAAQKKFDQLVAKAKKLGWEAA